MRVHPSSRLLALAFLFTTSYSQSLPYNPTTILLSSSKLAYVFLQSPESESTNQLLSLNVSTTLSTGNLSLEVVTQDLPFQTNDSTAFLPSISSSGDISVYAGSCSESTSAQLWTFSPDASSSIGSGTWKSQSTTTGSGITSAVMPGADFLSQAFSFSTLVKANASQTQLYIFGGMCPTSGATISTWQSAASYSNHMLRLSPDFSGSYNLQSPSSRGPPIAEAGFTITGLTPTYSNGSAMTQQQNFVLLGGHTQSAFINMSQVAIWSLPEESWSFVTVGSPPANANTELAVKSVATKVDSRSGHTSVLTEDGTQIIVFGGWVGDTTQAADPQLAILEIGSGFGGAGDWAWNLPTQQPSGPGMYGHGAVMLPGNVMMILGGYNVSSSGISRRDLITGTTPLFLNVTNMSWLTDYSNPAYVATVDSSTAHASSSKKSHGKSIGLGVGLGLGFAALLITALVLLWRRRQRRQRRVEQREKHISALSAGHAYYSPTRELSQRSGLFPWVNNGWNRDSDNQDGFEVPESSVAGYQNLNPGVHGVGNNAIPPVPRQIPRKPLHSRNARGLYQPATNFDMNQGRSNSLGTAGPIHPIYEADEDDNQYAADNGVGVALGEPEPGQLPDHQNKTSNPFRDPPINFSSPRHKTPGRQGSPDNESPARSRGRATASSREREIQEWVSDWAAADALLNTQARSHSAAGRVSPTRRAQLLGVSNPSSVSAEDDSGRTASNLSEQSVSISAMTISRSGSSSQGTRTNSLRGFISSAMNPFASLSTAVTSPVSGPLVDRSAKGGEPPKSAGSSGGSFTTAQSSFPALQAEGESLLPRPDESWRDRNGPQPGSPSKTKMAVGRRTGWLGSIRKAIVGDNDIVQNSPVSSFGNRTPSPTRSGDESSSGSMEPRRTVSAGAMLWRRKQGKSDWDDSEEPDVRSQYEHRSHTFTGDLHSLASGQDSRPRTRDTDDEEWDVERAIRNRVVQVMFTVPKEKLRVVNHDVEEDMSEVGSLRSKKGSNKSIKVVEPLIALDENPGDADAGAGAVTDVKGKGKESPASRVQNLVQNLERGANPDRISSPARI